MTRTQTRTSSRSSSFLCASAAETARALDLWMGEEDIGGDSTACSVDVLNVRVLADFVGPVQPGAADGVARDCADQLIEGEAGGQAGGLVQGEELEYVGVGPV